MEGHDVTTTPADDGFDVVCSCGWQANNPIPHKTGARAAERYHLSSAKLLALELEAELEAADSG